MTPPRRRLLRQGLALAAGGVPAWALAQAPVVEVQIRDNRYVPAHISIKAGTVVRWTNHEKRTPHTVKFGGPEGLESEYLFPGDSFERRFDRPGAYAYLCGPHPDMTGSIEVKP